MQAWHSQKESIMKIAKFKTTVLYSLVSSVCCSSGSALAQSNPPPDIQPLKLINMTTAPFSYPPLQNGSPANGSALQLFDVGQTSNKPVTIDLYWTPNSTTYSGLLDFRADSADTSFYRLKISSQYVTITNNQSGQIWKQAHSFQGTTAHYQLYETGSSFYVYDGDASRQQPFMTVSDTNPIASGVAIYAGSDGAGKWQLAAMQNQLGGSPIALPAGAAIVVPDVDHENPNGGTTGTQSMVTHLGYPQTTKTTVECIDVNPMGSNTPPSFPNPLGHVTCRREGGNQKNQQGNPKANDYPIYIFTDRIGIGKTVNGNLVAVSNGQKLTTGSVPSAKMSLTIVARNNSDGSVTITAYSGRAPGNLTQIVSFTDKGQDGTPPYLSGYQFGVYTEPGATMCWDNITLSQQ